MIRRRVMAALTAAVLAAVMSGCSTVGKVETSGETVSGEVSVSEESTVNNISAEATEAVDLYPDYPITYPEIQPQDTGDIYEAENCVLNGLTVSSERETYSGSGYVTGFSADGTNTIAFDVTVPSNQHYDLSFYIASESVVNCTILLNGDEISRFETLQTENNAFALITLHGVFIVNGECSIELRAEDGDIELDYLKISNNTSLSEISYDADGELSNENAAETAKELMSFLSENYGKYIITGQYVSDEKNSELDVVYKTTGKYPVIRFSALRNSGGSFGDCTAELQAMADWHNKGGIVGLMWHWECPGDKPSVYAKDTDFQLSKAVTDQDIALLSQQEILDLCNEGKISNECYEIIVDIDEMSQQLLTLKNKGIPVLWRPLHEASGDWFWWGADGEDAYKWLWELMYNRMTGYFGLDNLIWIWNGQSAKTLVDKETFDIAAMDIYLGEGKEFGSRYEQFAALQKLVGSDKLIALSECSSVPDIDASFRDNAVWLFFGLWYDSYLKDENGAYSQKYMPKESFIRAYNSDGALTLDEYKAMKDGTFKQENTAAQAETSSQAETSTEAGQ